MDCICFWQMSFLPCDFRFHEDEDEDEEGWYGGCEDLPHGDGLGHAHGVDEPAALLGRRWAQPVRDLQFLKKQNPQRLV